MYMSMGIEVGISWDTITYSIIYVGCIYLIGDNCSHRNVT